MELDGEIERDAERFRDDLPRGSGDSLRDESTSTGKTSTGNIGSGAVGS